MKLPWQKSVSQVQIFIVYFIISIPLILFLIDLFMLKQKFLFNWTHIFSVVTLYTNGGLIIS